MKKTIYSILILSIFIFVSANVFANPNSGYDITNKVKIYNDGIRTVPAYPNPQGPLKSSYMYGNKNFPLVGLTTYGSIFLDKKSCTFEVIDNVYMNMNPKDSYYTNRREHGTVITLACNEPAKECFCSTYSIDASLSKAAGDVSAWLADGKYFFAANTEKGKAFIENAKSLLSDSDEKAVDALKKEISEKIEKLPFAHLDLSKFQGKDMLKIFNSKIWEKVAEPCLGCGTCTYVCPTCMCFDVRDFSTGTDKGIRQIRCWDSCMYNDFTQMAAENPRHTQKERSRQRFMHKLMYYPMAHEGLFSCVGCGRCLESCPVNMNIVKVIKAVNETDDI